MPFDPAHLLARKDALGLSAQQVAQLTALENNAKPEMSAALQTAAGNAHWARVSTSLKARAALTEEQGGKVHGWADLRGGRWYSKGNGSRL